MPDTPDDTGRPAVNTGLPVSPVWQPIPSHACVACGDVGRIHPETTAIWGCLRCGFTTAAVATYFRPTASAETGDTGRRRAEAVERLIEARLLYAMVLNAGNARALSEQIIAARAALAVAMRDDPDESPATTAPKMYCPAGRLITKDKAPVCVVCGERLWKSIGQPYGGWPTHDAKGRRLGVVPTHHGTNKNAQCWNRKACEKRKVVALAR